jgi:hypothetical protein
MKRSSPALDQPLTNNDDEFHQTSYAKMARRSSPRSKYSYEEKTNQRVVRQDLLYFLDGISPFPFRKLDSSNFIL